MLYVVPRLSHDIVKITRTQLPCKGKVGMVDGSNTQDVHSGERGLCPLLCETKSELSLFEINRLLRSFVFITRTSVTSCYVHILIVLRDSCFTYLKYFCCLNLTSFISQTTLTLCLKPKYHVIKISRSRVW